MRNYVTNEFNNSTIAKNIALENREASDAKITRWVTVAMVAMMIGAFKYAIGG